MNAEELQQCREIFATSVTYLKSNVRNGVPGYVNRVDRMREVNDMCDQYIEATGERPDPDQLERLADAILHEELTDKRRDKVTIEDYPILSEHQFNRRKFGGRTNKQGVKLREVPLSVAAYVGTDGVDYRDAGTIARKATNSERKKQYREFTGVQPVTTTNIDDDRMPAKEVTELFASVDLSKVDDGVAELSKTMADVFEKVNPRDFGINMADIKGAIK